MNKLKKTLAILIFLVIGTSNMYAQQAVSNEINRLKADGIVFQPNKATFQTATTARIPMDSYFKNPNEVTYLQYDRTILESQDPFVSMEIPFGETSIKLDLIDVSDEFLDVNVEIKGEQKEIARTKYKHYRGLVRGNDQSLVSLSFFEDNAMGVISSESGNINIAKMDNSSDYIVYNEKNLKGESSFTCTMEEPEDFPEYDPDVLSGEAGSLGSSSGNCVGLYFETEYDIFQNLGSSANVLNYVTSLYNNLATIYGNDNIQTTLSQVVIWTVADPYTSTSTAGLLSQFQSQTSSINGDLGQLITFRNIGGGRAAGFNGICNSNVDQSLCVSGNMTSTITPFPNYSWNVMVTTHEFGHLFGSRHTHACVWNGNNTAIDGCSGFTEGGCSLPGVPSGGGTIMSYCHVTSAGINFSLGFGPQPGNVIRNIVDNASCLNSCCPTDLTITANVANGGVDHQEAENTITALNTVNWGGEAVYHAGDEVLLMDDFTAMNGSVFRAHIEGCSGNFVKSNDGNTATTNWETFQDEVVDALLISPNPARDQVTIDLSQSDLTWYESEIEIYDLKGQRIDMHNFIKVDRNKFSVSIAHLEKGMYIVKLIKPENDKTFVKRIVKM